MNLETRARREDCCEQRPLMRRGLSQAPQLAALDNQHHLLGERFEGKVSRRRGVSKDPECNEVLVTNVVDLSPPRRPGDAKKSKEPSSRFAQVSEERY